MKNFPPPVLPWFLAISLTLATVLSVQAEDKDGPFVRMIRHKDGSRTVTGYHSGMKIQEITTIDKDGVERLKRVNYLDKYGRPERFEYRSGTGGLLLHGQFVYDEKGRMAEELLYTPDGRLLRKLVQNYDFATGAKLAPTVEHKGALPPEIVRWMNPDGNDSGDDVEGGRSNNRTRSDDDDGERRGLFGIFKKKKD